MYVLWVEQVDGGPMLTFFPEGDQAEAAYIAQGISEWTPSKYLLRINPGEAFGMSSSTPVAEDQNYPFYGVDVLQREEDL